MPIIAAGAPRRRSPGGCHTLKWQRAHGGGASKGAIAYNVSERAAAAALLEAAAANNNGSGQAAARSWKLPLSTMMIAGTRRWCATGGPRC